MNTVVAKILLRRATDSALQSIVLSAGELAYSTDTKFLKIGDNITTWMDLPSFDYAPTRYIFATSINISNVSSVSVQDISCPSSMFIMNISATGGGYNSIYYIVFTASSFDFSQTLVAIQGLSMNTDYTISSVSGSLTITMIATTLSSSSVISLTVTPQSFDTITISPNNSSS